MKKLAILFPGQGSQYIGMGLDFYKEFKSAKNIFDEADSYFDNSLKKIIFESTEENLKKTNNAQAAILTTSYAIWSVLKDELKIEPDFMAGHSLGEYSALTAAGKISFQDAFNIVNLRGKYMEKAVPKGQGTMAAVMGLEKKSLQSICSEVSLKGDFVQLANINTPNQIVISGSNEGVKTAGRLAKENGARRVVPLSVSGPFHSKLMISAKERLIPVIDNTEFHEDSVPVVMNVTARPENNDISIKYNLAEQMISPVLWVDTIEWMIINEVDTFIECGPGKVLAGLVKKINKNVKIYSIEDIDSLTALKAEFRS